MRKILFPIIVMSCMIISCKKTLPNYGQTPTQKASNGWWVTFTQGGVDVYGLGTTFLSTYNTSGSADSIWIDDLGNTWEYKCKAAINYPALTFSTAGSENEYFDVLQNATAATVILANGKILPKAGHSKSGNVTDSIYVEATFSDDPTNTYIISGTARTGLIEDDY